MKIHLKRLALAAALLVPFAAAPLSGQITPEGTVIQNTATASWTDANGNSYTPVSASVSVTVGFLAGVDVTSAASVTPASPSTGNTLAFTVGNVGNGTDSVSVSTAAASGVTISGYLIGATTYATLAELNTALAGTAITSGGNVTVTVVYTVASGQGGQTIPVSLTATSRRDSGTSDTSTTNVSPPTAAGVSVTPDGATVDRLPSNGAPAYTATFTVSNGGNAADVFDLSASIGGGAVTIVSVNGTAGSTSTVAVGASGSATVDVTYTVGDVAAGTTDPITLTATSQNDGTVNDTGDVTVRVIRAALAITKAAYEDDQTTAITASDRVVPGDFVQYRITVTNNGDAPASSVQVTDALPSEVSYVSASGDAAGWSFSVSGSTVTADLTGTLAAGASRYVWIRVQVR